jgi:hypothetical protein
MIVDIGEPHPNLECEVCDDYDHCLPRWEDDGGGMGWLPPLEHAIGRDSRRDPGEQDGPPDAQHHQSL